MYIPRASAKSSTESSSTRLGQEVNVTKNITQGWIYWGEVYTPLSLGLDIIFKHKYPVMIGIFEFLVFHVESTCVKDFCSM